MTQPDDNTAAATAHADAQPPCAGLPPALAESLRALLGDRFTTSLATREQHGRGESYHAVQAPDGV